MDETRELSTFEQRIANIERTLTRREIDKLSDQSFWLGVGMGIGIAVWLYCMWQIYTEKG